MASTATTRRPFTLADPERFPDDGNRYELLDVVFSDDTVLQPDVSATSRPEAVRRQAYSRW